MKLVNKILSFWIFFVFSTQGNSQLVPSDEDYRTLETPFATYIYTDDYRPYLPELLKHHQKLDLAYRPSFDHTLDEKPVLVLASIKNQIPNAFATTLPYTFSMIYPAGSAIMGELSIANWTTSVLTHEYAHLYQLNPKKDVGRLIHTIFGNHPFFVLPIIPILIFPSPNFATPLWLLEGNAVLNESSWGKGGRGFSGHYRSLFYSLLRENKLNEARLTNMNLEFPGYEEKYIVGTYFMIYLADRYGLDKVNSFFQEQAEHYLLPLILNKTFEKHFGKDYSTLIEDFLSFYKGKADQAISLKEKTILSSFYSTEFYKENDHIYFLTKEDKTDKPTLHIMNTIDQSFKHKKDDFFMGKVYPINGDFYTATTSLVDFTDIHFGLFNKDKNEIKKFKSHLLLDKKGGNTLTLDIKKSIDTIHLVKNFQEIIPTDSYGLLNHKGDVFHFRQDKNTKTLYKNNTPLYSYKGHYSKIVAVEKINSRYDKIYFIANSKKGQGLYLFNTQTKKSYKVLPSDFINNAIPISDGKILVEEISGEGYHYKIAKEDISPDKPYEYNYAFLRHSPQEREKELNSKVGIEYSLEKIKSDEEEYKSLKRIKYSNWRFNYIKNESISASTLFIDPLGHNIVNAGFTAAPTKNKEDRDIYLYYINQKYRASFLTEISFIPVEEESLKQKPHTALGIQYPFFDKKRWTLYGETIGHYTLNSKHPFSSYFSLSLKKNVMYNYSFSPRELYRVYPEIQKKYQGHKKSMTTQVIYDVGYENILSFEGNYTYSSTGYHTLNKPIKETNALQVKFLYPSIKTRLNAKKIESYRATLGYKKVLNWGHYFKAFPLSLRRFAPYGFYSLMEYKLQQENKTTQFSSPEIGLGIDFELLFAHQIPFHFKIAKVSRKKDKKNNVSISLSADI